MSDDLDQLAGELQALAEQLTDRAIDRLRRATDPEDPGAAGAAAEERRITRARRAVEKAVALLAGPRPGSSEDP
jgi:hypothetical protein